LASIPLSLVALRYAGQWIEKVVERVVVGEVDFVS